MNLRLLVFIVRRWGAIGTNGQNTNHKLVWMQEHIGVITGRCLISIRAWHALPACSFPLSYRKRGMRHMLIAFGSR